QSLGAAVAAYAAGDLGERSGGDILESPYRAPRTAGRDRTPVSVPPVVDDRDYYRLAVGAPLFFGGGDRRSSVNAVVAIPSNVPVLVVAGSKDLHARPFEAEAIHERLGARSRLVIVEGAAHGQLMVPDPTGYERTVTEFLATTLP